MFKQPAATAAHPLQLLSSFSASAARGFWAPAGVLSVTPCHVIIFHSSVSRRTPVWRSSADAVHCESTHGDGGEEGGGLHNEPQQR